jgi:cell division protein FtsB
MSVTKRRLRLRWRKLAGLAIAAYLSIWFGQSLVHYVVLRGEEANWQSQIQTAKAMNAALSRDIQDLRNPAYLKRMVAGKAVTPRPPTQLP